MEDVRVIITYSDVDGLISITVDGKRLDISAIKEKDIKEWFEESEGRDGWEGLITEIQKDIGSNNTKINFEFNGPKEIVDKFNNILSKYGYENYQEIDEVLIYKKILNDAKMAEHRGFMDKAVEKYRKAAEGGEIAEAQFWLAEYYKNKFINNEYGTEIEKSDLIYEMLKYYEKAANQNYMDAQRCLVDLYEEGNIVSKNEEEAFKWNCRMAELGDISAQIKVGDYYKKRGKSGDYEKAVEYYKRATDAGSLKAENKWGLMFLKGGVCESSASENERKVALKRIIHAAENGFDKAQYNLGNFYFCGENGLNQNYQKAFEWYIKSAEQGNSYAQYDLGYMYYLGKGIQKDYQEAFRWGIKCAQQGNDAAQNNIGNMYYYGNGVEKDYEKAFEWYIKSAEQGNSNAQNNLGDMYYYGNGVEKNYEKAFEWYIKSAEQGNSNAQYSLGYMYCYGNGVEKNYQEAFEWYIKSAEQGDSYAQNNIGNTYYYGNGVEKNYQEAFKWYIKSAEQGNSNAQNNIGDMYYYGDVVEKNYQRAFEWYKVAAENGSAMSCYTIAEHYYNQIDNNRGAKTIAAVAASVLIPVTNFVTIPAGLVGSAVEKKIKIKNFLKTDSGKEMLKYYRIGAELGHNGCKDRIKELEKYL